jgi:hypothetical protein
MTNQRFVQVDCSGLTMFVMGNQVDRLKALQYYME